MRVRVLALVLVVLAAAAVLTAFSMLHWRGVHQVELPGVRPLSAWQYQRLLGIGLAVDWLNYRWVHHWYFYWRSRGFSFPEMIREEGFKHVRIRLGGDVVVNKTLLRELRVVVNDCLKAGLIPIVAYSAPELRSGNLSAAAQEHFIQWWVTVAKYLRNESYLVSYDLIIESSGALKDRPQLLNKLYNETIAAIRSVDPYRIIMVTPARVSSPFALKYLHVRFDNYVLAEWHIYAGGPKMLRGGEPFNKTLVREAIQAALNWSRRTHVPVYMGAWRPNRVLKHSHAKLPGREPVCKYPLSIAINFSKYMAGQLCMNHIPFTVNADTLFINYENHEWFPAQKPVIEAIVSACKVTLSDGAGH